MVKGNTGSGWEVIVDAKPRTYSHNMQLAIEAAEYLKLKNPAVEITVRDLEGAMETVVIPPQSPRVPNDGVPTPPSSAMNSRRLMSNMAFLPDRRDQSTASCPSG